MIRIKVNVGIWYSFGGWDSLGRGTHAEVSRNIYQQFTHNLCTKTLHDEARMPVLF